MLDPRYVLDDYIAVLEPLTAEDVKNRLKQMAVAEAVSEESQETSTAATTGNSV